MAALSGSCLTRRIPVQGAPFREYVCARALLAHMQSVVLSGGYEDDRDEGEWFLYTGSGGKDLSGNKRTNKVRRRMADCAVLWVAGACSLLTRANLAAHKRTQMPSGMLMRVGGRPSEGTACGCVVKWHGSKGPGIPHVQGTDARMMVACY